MSLHLGNDFIITTKQIICILTLKKPKNEKYNLFAEKLLPGQDLDRKRKIGSGPFRSVVLCEKGTIYFSPINTPTLIKRVK
jgi:hypothetical protein